LSNQTPRVSIGLPVYNGGAFLAEAMDSLLAQTFADFELIVADNASTDATESICRERAGRDPRVRYLRNENNIGAMRNFNKVLELAHGEYFKWVAHDDLHEPDSLARCVEVLDARPEVALVYPAARVIDETGHTMRTMRQGLRTDEDSVALRFRDLIRREHSCVAIFGLMRAEVIRSTRMLADYADCDRVLLAEIGLAGRVVELPEPLFVHRQHKNRSVWQYTTRQTRGAWFDPAKAGRPAMPYSRQFLGYLGAIRRAHLSLSNRLACHALMVRWLGHNADGLWEDVTFAARFVLRPLKRRFVPASGNESGSPESPK
jgi:glycosyltransferase involved in cell wall biosynthesis